ncbi:hypothetical protein F0562_010290 [Nyssa sinensis]|uniref:Uncharacterized protein n=1 Tax=Nyssa sinensis TaxID=561372 RepID=A0A5J5A3G8_9ASTE|nr:hypothetical protein F0562_010290 [Nyssa sinensis]
MVIWLNSFGIFEAEQLYKDQCVLSAYNQLENFCDCIYTNIGDIGKRSELSGAVIEAVSSLIFAASRCGELPELNLIRYLFKKHFGDDFERLNVELKPGNSVNSQIQHNLDTNLVPDNVKFQLASEIAKEYTLLGPQSDEQNFLTQGLELEMSNFSNQNHKPKKDGFSDLGIRGISKNNGNGPMRPLKFKDLLRKIGSKFSLSTKISTVAVQMESQENSSRRSTASNGSPQIQDTSIVCLVDMEELSGKHMSKNARSEIDEIKEGLSSYNELEIVTSSCKEEIEEKEEDESKPRLSHVHPKLPDYDDLVAKFRDLKEEHMQNNSNTRTLRGLYGTTAALDSQSMQAIGVPVQPPAGPALSKCHIALDGTTQDKVNCCPPFSTANAINFVPPPSYEPLRVRQPAHKLDAEN